MDTVIDVTKYIFRHLHHEFFYLYLSTELLGFVHPRFLVGFEICTKLGMWDYQENIALQITLCRFYPPTAAHWFVSMAFLRLFGLLEDGVQYSLQGAFDTSDLGQGFSV